MAKAPAISNKTIVIMGGTVNPSSPVAFIPDLAYLHNPMPSDQTLITAAVFAEVKPLVRRLGLRPDGATRWIGDRASLVLTGMGERAGACVRSEISGGRFDRVLSVGVAGALREGYTVGDLLVPVIVIGPDGNERTPRHEFKPDGVLVTADVLVASPDEKRALAARYDADAVDMETAHIGSVCDEFGVGWSSLRTISDTIDDAVPAALGEMVTDAGQPHLSRIIAWALRRPSRIKTLTRLGRNTRTAAECLADAVADRL